MADLRLVVGGRQYGGWKAINVVRSMESLAGSFDLDVSDRWGGQDVPWPIREEDPCRVAIDGETVIDGYVDKRRISVTGKQRNLGFAGRDRAAALVDSSAVLDRWTFRNASVLDVARAVAAPFGVPVSLQAGLVLPKAQPKLVVNPGDSPYEVMQRAGAYAGVLFVSDGAGGVVIVRAGSIRATTALVEGENVLEAGVEYDASQRFARYVIATQTPGSDTASAAATRVRAEATDESVRRRERVLLIRPDAGVTTDYARQRADWEARVRAAMAESVTVTVVGWRQPSGPLWPVNALVKVQIPSIGVDGDMLIAEVGHAISNSGEVSNLSLVRPDAFLPEPRLAKVKSSGGAWKELS